uniref:Uncharacterized protein n=1 Tax=Timema genevievae TaxID=629358 RepID=A0A7R9K5P5_TIMGE|nr:unnamed protein product [Timema genevievae]
MDQCTVHLFDVSNYTSASDSRSPDVLPALAILFFVSTLQPEDIHGLDKSRGRQRRGEYKSQPRFSKPAHGEVRRQKGGGGVWGGTCVETRDRATLSWSGIDPDNSTQKANRYMKINVNRKTFNYNNKKYQFLKDPDMTEPGHNKAISSTAIRSFVSRAGSTNGTTGQQVLVRRDGKNRAN